MKKLNFLLVQEITDCDILENIEKDTIAVLVDEDDCYIEVKTTGYYVSEGMTGNSSTNLLVAMAYLNKFKKDNGIS
jgi:hypothetical protein